MKRPEAGQVNVFCLHLLALEPSNFRIYICRGEYIFTENAVAFTKNASDEENATLL